MHFDLDDANQADLDGAHATRTIIPLELALGLKFNITSTMIQLLKLKVLFSGLPRVDPNMHLVNFMNICKSFDYPRVGKNAISLRLFPFSLFTEATLWMNELEHKSLINWRQLIGAFLERFFMPSRMFHLRDEISNFRQLSNDALHET